MEGEGNGTQTLHSLGTACLAPCSERGAKQAVPNAKSNEEPYKRFLFQKC